MCATVWSWKNNCFEAAGWCYTTCPMLPCREAEEPAASEAASCPESWCDCILCTFLYKGMQSVRWKTSSLPRIVALLRTFRRKSSKEIQFWISHLFFLRSIWPTLTADQSHGALSESEWRVGWKTQEGWEKNTQSISAMQRQRCRRNLIWLNILGCQLPNCLA